MQLWKSLYYNVSDLQFKTVYFRVGSFPFSKKRSNSVIFCDCNFRCFLGFYTFFPPYECNVWKCRDQQDRPIYTTLTDKIWKFLLNFQRNSTSLRFLMINFTSRYSKNSDFLDNICFLVAKTLFSVIFCVFPFVLNSVIFPFFPYHGKHATLHEVW